MNRTIQLTDETYERLLAAAEERKQSPEAVIHDLLAVPDNQRYQRANEAMLAQGVLASIPKGEGARDDSEPEGIPGRPLSELIIEERR